MPSEYFLNSKKIHCADTGEDCIGYKEYLTSNHWLGLRSKFIGSETKCQHCGKSGVLQLHHVSYERLGHEEREDFLILCPKCHAKVHKKKAKYGNRTAKKGRSKKKKGSKKKKVFVFGESDLSESSAKKVIKKAHKKSFDQNCTHYLCQSGIQWCELGYRYCPYRKCGDYKQKQK